MYSCVSDTVKAGVSGAWWSGQVC